MEKILALTNIERVLSAVRRGWNQTFGQYFKYDIYGIRLFGIQITPKQVADILKKDNGGRFSEAQLFYYYIHLVFDAYYIFIPRLGRFLECRH